jgi:hypothetical protein
VEINDNELHLARQMLGILSGAYVLEHSAKIINGSSMNQSPEKELVSEQELALILKRPDMADAFIKLISQIRNNGGEVPLPVVQWVLGMNRQRVLNRKIGSSQLSRRLFYSFAGEALSGVWNKEPHACADALQLLKAMVFGR